MAEAARAERLPPLAGVTVLERAGSLAVAACTHLLSALGARIVRLEMPDEAARLEAAAFAERRLRVADKTRVTVDPRSCVPQWRDALARADVVVLDPPHGDAPEHAALAPLMRDPAPPQVVCVFSAEGVGANGNASGTHDALIQALGGLMAVSGHKDGAPEIVRVPIAQLAAAVIGVTAVASALRQRARTGRGTCIDLALVEIVADQLRAHVGLVARGRARGFRMGCEHPLCAPWNAYRARDGWLLVCSSGDAHWRALAGLMQRPEAAQDARFATMRARRENAAEADALVQAWAAQHTIAEALRLLHAADIPAGPALAPAEVPHDPVLRQAGTFVRDPSSGAPVPRAPWRFRCVDGDAAESSPAHAATASTRRAADTAAGEAPPLPLAGIRVLEITRYAAGPLGGFVLASLGAEVIKIEPPGGEECRAWSPSFGGVSGYFANHNAGKRFAVADLRDPQARTRVEELIASADVVLHNMRPGAMERLGLGAERLCARNPALVYCAISGFGPHGPQLPALDTVVQAHLGLTALVGAGEPPARVGVSIADQLAGHLAAAGIVAALLARDHDARGSVLDVAMVDALAWLTHPAWTGAGAALPPATRIATSDGWVVAACAEAAARSACPEAETLSRDTVAAALARRGIDAAPVLEVDEVLAHPTLRARRSVCAAATGGEDVPVFVAPLGMPVRRPERVGAAGENHMQWNPR